MVSHSHATVSILEIEPGVSKSIRLSFPYKHLTEQERADVIILPAGSYTTLNPESLKAVVMSFGGISMFIGLYNSESSKLLTINCSYSTDIKSLAHVIKTELGSDDRDKITGVIYFNSQLNEPFVTYENQEWKNYFKGYFGPDSLEYNAGLKYLINNIDFRQAHLTYGALWGNQDSEIVLKQMKENILEILDMSDHYQIKALKATRLREDLKDYEFADMSIYITKEFNIYSYCFYHEKIMSYIKEYNNEYDFQKIEEFCKDNKRLEAFRKYQSYSAIKCKSHSNQYNGNTSKRTLIRFDK